MCLWLTTEFTLKQNPRQSTAYDVSRSTVSAGLQAQELFHCLIDGERDGDHWCHLEVVECEPAEETVTDAVLLHHHQDGCVPRTETRWDNTW